MFALVACIHSHPHTHTLSLSLKRSHQAGMSVVFTYRDGAHLIEELIFMGSANRTLPLLLQDRIWPNMHGESTIWHIQPLISFSFQFILIMADSCPFIVALLSYTQCESSFFCHCKMSLITELSFTHFTWIL